MRAACAHREACRVRPLEFQLRRLRRDVVRRQVLVRACHLVRRGRHQGAEDIFLEVLLLGAMAYQGEARQDAFGQARLQDENSEVRPDAAVHQTVDHRGELEISALAEEDRQRVALFQNLFPNLFLKPTREHQMAQQRQDVVQPERPAGRVRRDEAELPDAAQMAQLRVSPGPQEQPPPEPLRVSQQQVLERADELVDGRSSLKMPARGRKACQRDASLGFPELQQAPRVSLLREAQHFPGPLKALLLVAQAWPQPQDVRPVSSPRSPLLASPLRPQLPSPPALRNVFAQAPRARGRGSSNASSFL